VLGNNASATRALANRARTISHVFIRLDGRIFGTAQYGFFRDDIKEIFQGHKNSLLPDFVYRYDSKEIPNWRHYLDILIEDEDGNLRVTGRRMFSILN